MFVRSALFVPLAGFMLASVPQSAAQTCLSYGIDFVSGGSYFINTNSNESFTAVSQFSGCQNDTANIIVVDPNGDEYECTDVPLQPDYTSEMSTCPLIKSDMFSGAWDITIISNNGDGEPIAYQRDFYISAGPQQTVTATPTVQYNLTTTPTVTSTSTQTVSSVVTISNSLTTVIPTGTRVKTVTPRPTTTTATTTLTRTIKSWTRTAYFTTVTVTASCTVPPRPQNPDPTWHMRPKILHSLPSGLSNPGQKRDETSAPRMYRRLSDQLEANQIDRRNLAKRSADAPTVTVTGTATTATTTATFEAPTSTVAAIVITTVTSTSVQPPVTIYSGLDKQTVTAPQQTKTRYAVTTSYTQVVRTMTASFTSTSTILPSASVTACKRQGGHFGGGWSWRY